MRSSLSFALLVLAACASTGGREAAAGLGARPTEQVARLAPFDVEHYALELRLDPRARSLEGTCRVRLWPVQEPLDQVALDLVGLQVEAVHDERGRALAFAHQEGGFGDQDGGLLVQLAETASPGAPLELAIRYGGVPRKGLWFVADEQGVATQVFTQGQCRAARWWFPCFDEPHDRATSEVSVELPAGWRSVAAGELVERRELGDGRVAEHWRMPFPHPTYLVTLAAGDFVQASDAWDGIPLTFLAAPDHADLLQDSLASTPSALELLSELTGVRYPFSKYSQTCVDGFPLGGMENVSATTLTATALRDELGLRDYDPAGLVVHEAAHQWFGNLLTCRDWSHVWLNEGFATYVEQLHLERSAGEDEFLLGVRAMQEAYLAADVGANRRPTVWNVYIDPDDLFWGGHTYDGGGSRLHLLRGVVGDEAFFEGLRAYVAENAGRGVVTEDLRRSLEAASGRDLSTLFRQWFHERGYPELEVRWSWDEAAREVVLRIEQVQEYADGTPVVFRLPAEVEVRTAEDGELHRIELAARRQTLRLPAPERPRWVRFDPRAWIPKRLSETRPLATWLDLAENTPRASGRCDALAVLGRVLAEEGSGPDEREAVVALARELLGSDGVPAVRAAAARVLGSGGARTGEVARADLQAAAAGDPAASVRVECLRALGSVGTDEELSAFAREQFELRFSWRTMGAAAELVRRSEPDGDAAYAWLAERLDMPSPHDELRADLLGTLAATGKARSLEILHSFALDPGAGQAARVVAVRELGRRARHDTRIREDLVALLDTPLYRLRAAVVEALGEIGGARSLEALERAHAHETDTRIRRRIEAIVRAERARA